MKNPFKNDKSEAFTLPKKSPPKRMKVYLRDFRPECVQTNISQPGTMFPEVDDWMVLVPMPRDPETGQPRSAVKIPKDIKTVFRGGMAEVDQKLGTYLINEGIAFAKPQKAMAAA